MKLKEYIDSLQKIYDKHGDLDVVIQEDYECGDLSWETDFEEPQKPKFNKYSKNVVIHHDTIFFD